VSRVGFCMMDTDRFKGKIENVALILMDVDGVLTDGGIILGTKNSEYKVFDVQDGMGVTLARIAGLKVGLITGRQSDIVARRAEELHMDVCYQGVPDKLGPYLKILEKYGLSDEQVCYIGDDLLEMVILERAGFSVAVANARPEVKDICDYVTENHGGHGAIRETIELILKGQGKWQNVLGQIKSHFQSREGAA